LRDVNPDIWNSAINMSNRGPKFSHFIDVSRLFFRRGNLSLSRSALSTGTSTSLSTFSTERTVSNKNAVQPSWNRIDPWNAKSLEKSTLAREQIPFSTLSLHFRHKVVASHHSAKEVQIWGLKFTM